MKTSNYGSIKKMRFHRKCLYFVRNSNIHGLRFIFAENCNILSRVYWLAAMACSCAGLYLLMLAIMDTLSGATVSFTPNTLYLDWHTAFPAVTVCEKYNYRKSLKRLTELYPDLITAQDYTRRKYLADLTYGEGTCKDCEPCGTKVPCDVDWRAMSDAVRKSCSELVGECSWSGERFDCCSRFLPIDSESGMCFAINTRQSQVSMPLPLLKSDRTTGPGELVFHALTDLKVSVHSVEEIATNSLSDELIFVIDATSNDRTDFIFTIVEMENDEELASQPVEFRACRYLHEQLSSPMMEAYPVYSHSACLLACETWRRFEWCGCVSHLRDLTYRDHYCNFTGLNCLTKYEEQRKMNQDSINDLTCHHCMPSCVESELKRIDLRRYSVEASEEEPPPPPVGVRVSVRMPALPSLRYTRNMLRTNLDLVVSVGGIAGLFFGASLLSVAEAIYLSCVQRHLPAASVDVNHHH